MVALGVPDYDVNAMATRQEMRGFVCGQCHVEYYFKGPEKRAVLSRLRRVGELERLPRAAGSGAHSRRVDRLPAAGTAGAPTGAAGRTAIRRAAVTITALRCGTQEALTVSSS